MKYALFIPTFLKFSDPDLVLTAAIEAEAAGWDGVFLPDHLFHFGEMSGGILDPWIMLSAIGSKTSKIKLGTWVTPLPRRQPWQVARDLATLDQLTEGRVILGAGLGSPPSDYTGVGLEYSPKLLAEKLDESLEVIELCWKGEAFSFNGKHYQFNNVKSLPVPYQKPRIPIWLAGRWPAKKPLKRGARWDGIMPISSRFPQPMTKEELNNSVEYYKSCREENELGDILVEWRWNNREERRELHDYCEGIGVTWMMDSIDPREQSAEDLLELIKKGPDM